MAHKHSLPCELTIYAVGPARSLFGGWIAKLPKGRRAAALDGTELPVESSGVSDIDAAGVQLLVSLSRSLSARNRKLRLVDPSGPLAAACRSLGVAGLLGDPNGASA